MCQQVFGLLVWFLLLEKYGICFCLFFFFFNGHEEDPKRKGLCLGVNGVCMKLSHSWLHRGAVPAEHMAETQFITAGASKTSATSVNFLELAKFTCFCRIQRNKTSPAPSPSSLKSRAYSQQGASPLDTPCSARMLPGQTVHTQRVGEWHLTSASHLTAGKGPSPFCSSSLWSLKCWTETLLMSLLIS